jgi:hypothetical protein
MRCKDCSQVRGYPYKRSHLVADRRMISVVPQPSAVARMIWARHTSAHCDPIRSPQGDGGLLA